MNSLFQEEMTMVPEWLRKFLVAAGIYNILWGLVVLIIPELLFNRFNIPAPSYQYLWQCIGAFEGAFGIGYLLASKNPSHHWLLILIGLLTKIFVPFVFLFAWLANTAPGGFGWVILINDLIWWLPLGLLVHHSYQEYILERKPLEGESFLELEFNMVQTNTGIRLSELSEFTPVILVFLRHFGCTYCRETLQELKAHYEQVQQSGKELVLVHMSDPDFAERFLAKYGLEEVQHISDQNRDLYRYFGLHRGFLGQVLGVKNWVRFLSAGIFKGHFMGAPKGDVLQMPGIFIYYQGKVKMKYIYKSAADQPDYERIIGCSLGN